MNKKYIDVDEAFDVITDFAGQAETKSAYGAYWKAAKAIKNLPSVSISPVREGKWNKVEEDLGGGVKTYRFACSECGFLKNTLTGNYCPNCGAKMLTK